MQFTSNETLSDVVNLLSTFLEERPTEFAITILPIHREENIDEENKLALEESIVLVEKKYLGLDARSLPWITRTIRKDYRNLKRYVAPAVITDVSKRQKLFMATSCLLLVNPDHATAWADRRRCLLMTKENHDRWQDEIQFLNLLMTQHSKAPSSWGHRKYVLQKLIESTMELIETGQESNNSIVNIVLEEIKVCEKIAERYPKNYYAWTHRRFLWTRSGSLPYLDHESLTQIFQQEFDTLFNWLNLHISDHSAVHYQCQVLDLLLMQYSSTSNEAEMFKIAKQSIDTVQTLVKRHPGHEALWILRRMVNRILLNHAKTCSETNYILSLVYSDIDKVHQDLESKTHPMEIHAWTFLVWCITNLHLVPPDNYSKMLQKALVHLKGHSNIVHQLWNV